MRDQERLDRIDELEEATGNLMAGLDEDYEHEDDEDDWDDDEE